MTKAFDVDFQHVRSHADFAAVLAHYGIELKGTGEQRKALCPFHTDTRPSLNINLQKRVFNCFVCGVGGNVIDFVAKLDKGVSNVRQAAQLVASLSHIEPMPGSVRATSMPTLRRGTAVVSATAATEESHRPAPVSEANDGEGSEEADGILVNRPLTFTLKLEPLTSHPLLAALDTTSERLLEQGIGVAQRGSMKDRLAIPIYNAAGDLVAHCGRHLGEALPEDEVKYKFPAGFKKSLELYGIERVRPEVGMIVLVESFLSVIKLGAYAARGQQLDVVGLMGTLISAEQVTLLKALGKAVLIVFDGDEAGHMGSHEVAGAVASAGLWTMARPMPDSVKPHHLDAAGFWQHLAA